MKGIETMFNEPFHLQNIYDNMNLGNDLGQNLGKKLVYDKRNKSYRDSTSFDDPDGTIELSSHDMEVY